MQSVERFSVLSYHLSPPLSCEVDIVITLDIERQSGLGGVSDLSKDLEEVEWAPEPGVPDSWPADHPLLPSACVFCVISFLPTPPGSKQGVPAKPPTPPGHAAPHAC